MKHKGAISQTYLKRDQEIVPKLIRHAMRIATYPTTTRKLAKIAADLPVSEFCISDDAALSYIRKRILNGIHPKFMSPYKQKLFDALYDEVKKMMDDTRYQNRELVDIVLCALSRPAPCVGLTPFVILQIYFETKKLQNNEQI